MMFAKPYWNCEASPDHAYLVKPKAGSISYLEVGNKNAYDCWIHFFDFADVNDPDNHLFAQAVFLIPGGASENQIVSYDRNFDPGLGFETGIVYIISHKHDDILNPPDGMKPCTVQINYR